MKEERLPIEVWTDEFDDVFVHEENEAQTVDGGGFPYAQDMSQRGGVFLHDLDPDEFINRELNKVLGCGSTALGLEGIESLSRYYSFIFCMRWFCRECGSKGGRIHKKRVNGVRNKISAALGVAEEELMKVFDLRQVVFTVPVEWRKKFLSRKAINALYGMAERIIKAEFPGKLSVIYFHAFGEKNPDFYHPHMNVHILEEKGQRLELGPDVIARLKKKWYKALVHYGCRKEELGVSSVEEGIRMMNVHYSFQTAPGKKAHRIKYMCRPWPGFVNYQAVKKDPVLKALFLGEKGKGGMQGFQYVRYFNGFRKAGEKDIDRKAEMQERENWAGERLRVARDRDGHIMYKTKMEIELLHREKDMEELGDGFYKVIEEKEKKKRGRKWRESQELII